MGRPSAGLVGTKYLWSLCNSLSVAVRVVPLMRSALFTVRLTAVKASTSSVDVGDCFDFGSFLQNK